MSTKYPPIEFRAYQACPACGEYAVHDVREAPDVDQDEHLTPGEDSAVLDVEDISSFGGGTVATIENVIYRADQSTCLSIRTCVHCKAEFPTF